METEEGRETGGGGDVSIGEASWLQGKAEMLDEVNQLVELMTAEKSILHEKISALESEVEGYHRETEELRLSEKEHVLRQRLEQSLLKEKNSKEQTELLSALRKTKKELRRVQQQLELMAQSLEAEKQCHTAVTSRLETAEKSNKGLSKELQQQQTENKKLQELLVEAQDQAKEAQSDTQALQMETRNAKQKEQKLRQEILALRGRLGRSERAHSQLQTHCSVLERELEAHVQQMSCMRTRRSREEIRLLQECRKKDELVSTYLQKLSTSHEEQLILKKEIRRLKMKLSSEEKQRKELTLKLKESEQNYQDHLKKMEEITRSREEEDQRAALQLPLLVEEARRLTDKLDSSRDEMSRMRLEVVRLREREQNYSELLKKKQDEVISLHRQLESAWTERRSSLQQAEVRWAERLTDARSDYERLKEVSTRRCTELAREVWQLKSELESRCKP